MKIYLSSFNEKEYFGPGRLIGVVSGRKPLNLKIKIQFPNLTPQSSLIDDYNKQKLFDPILAGKNFEDKFKNQLNNFVTAVKKKSIDEQKSIQEILPFKEGDTLLSWERSDRTHYRKPIAEALIELGYDVILH